VSESEGISIYADCGEFGMPTRDWRRILWLAEVYGWKPRGTTPPNEYAIDAGIWKGKPEDWDGSYFPALGQEIVEADAEELALSIERALPDIPDAPRSEQKDPKQQGPAEWFADVPPGGVNCFQAFADARKEMLRAFILHCREKNGLCLY
jgi:hypothetical protein